MSCCPPGSWGELKPDPEYVCKGVVEKVSGLDIYKVGKSDKVRYQWLYKLRNLCMDVIICFSA